LVWLLLLFTGGDMNKLIFTSEELDALIEQIRAHERAKFVLPDVLNQGDDSPGYVEGWNECREVMRGMMK
jgi:hypothetical protein